MYALTRRLIRALRYRKIKLQTKILNFFWVTRYSNLNIKLDSAIDFPSIAATPKQKVEITIEGSKRTILQLNRLIGVKTSKIQKFYLNESDEVTSFSEELKLLFDKHGSDKGSRLGYNQIYAQILLNKDKLSILEIGIGTNNVSLPSNMGIDGKVGASLKAWQELDCVDEVIGLDIDSSILFQSNKIKTYYLDQTDVDSWKKLKEKTGFTNRFDLIIDDGLHAPFANIITIHESLDLIKIGGCIVIEDIHARSLPIWELFLHNISDNLEGELYKFRKAYLLIIKRLN